MTRKIARLKTYKGVHRWNWQLDLGNDIYIGHHHTKDYASEGNAIVGAKVVCKRLGLKCMLALK